MNYRGPRFNVLFYNAAGTFCWAKHLIDYIQNSKSTMNFTVTYILKALMNNIILALCRAYVKLSQNHILTDHQMKQQLHYP